MLAAMGTGAGRHDRFATLAVLGLTAVLVLALLRFRQPFPFDDGAFFLRYAEHLGTGRGYVWNPGVTDAIGASAPIWPLLLAVPIAVGMEPYAGGQLVAVLVAALGFALLLAACRRLWGGASLLPAALAISSSSALLVSTMGIMETPLTMLLLAASVWLLAAPTARPRTTAVAAALLVVHKADLLPWAAGLLLAAGHWRLHRAHRQGLLLAAGVVATYFTLMYWHTGHLFPVSLLRKLHNSSGALPTMPRDWFLQAALLGNRRWLLLLPALLGAISLFRRRSGIGVLLACGCGGQALAYTLFPPTEPFLWYLAPMEFAIAVTVAGAAAGGLPAITIDRTRRTILILTCVAAGHLTYKSEKVRGHWLAYSAEIEGDRSRAGLWVAEHSPADFRVLTGFGCPAFFCRRQVYDYSGLNMTGDVDITHLLTRERPELLIFCPFGSAIPPEQYVAPADYEVVEVFDGARRAGRDFYAVVMVRSDVATRLSH
jgi:hypothetical protein